jgi:lysophospholipase L1-like esterase
MKKLGDILLVIGGGMLCLVPAIYLMRLAGVITSVHIMLWIFGGASILFGGLLTSIDKEQSLRLLGHKVVDCYKAVAILTLNALVLYAGLDFAARSIFKITDLISSPAQQLVGEGNPREKVSYYSSQDWAERYWYEHRLSSKQRYYPYVGWRRAPFKGEFIEIDQNGIRLTPGADCSAKSFKVFTFGESSMWGTGSPDWGTIPANLQKGLEKLKQGPVCVMNFAESAYTSTQDTIMLLLQLQAGNIPDLVLFYNIGGDIAAGYQSGRPGVHANLDDIAARFEGRSEPPTFVDRLRSTYSYSLIDQLMGKLTIANPQQKEPTPSKMATYESKSLDIAKLGDWIVQDYWGAHKIVNALAQKYGFKYFFFLPPNISLGNKPLTLEEQEMKYKVEADAEFDKLYTAVYQTIEREASKYQNFYSLVDAFDSCGSLIWIDGGHVTPIGNQLIAKRMLDIIQARSSDESNPQFSIDYSFSGSSTTSISGGQVLMMYCRS